MEQLFNAIINTLVYRPLDTFYTDFTRVMNKLEQLLSEKNSLESTVIIIGYFNFPFIEKKRNKEGACNWKKNLVNWSVEKQKHSLLMVEEKKDEDCICIVLFPSPLGRYRFSFL